ncbi:hypothetical protein TPAR_02699, partial [Tolypocladium paradoxum]
MDDHTYRQDMMQIIQATPAASTSSCRAHSRPPYPRRAQDPALVVEPDALAPQQPPLLVERDALAVARPLALEAAERHARRH